ncbi:MAG: hypothetical protein ACYDFT_01725 [Thermoplasmata archaeon]
MRGTLTVFTSDRMRGLLECLVAHGLLLRRFFTNLLAGTLATTSIVVVLGVGSSVGSYVGPGNRVTTRLLLPVGDGNPHALRIGAVRDRCGYGLFVPSFFGVRGQEPLHRPGPFSSDRLAGRFLADRESGRSLPG